MRYWILASVISVGLVQGCSSRNSSDPTYSSGPRIVHPDPVLDVKDPQITANVYFAAAQVSEQQGKIADAKNSYREALRLDPNHDKSLYGLAVLSTRTKEYDQAIAAWERYIRVTDNQSLAWTNLGYTYDLAGKTTNAEAAYKTAINLDPHSVNARVNFGLMLARLGRLDEAEHHLSIVQQPAIVQYNLAAILETQGQIDSARIRYARALQLDPNLNQARVRLAGLQ